MVDLKFLFTTPDRFRFFSYGALTVIALVTIGVFLILSFGDVLLSPSLTVTPSRLPPLENVCPGTATTYWVTITVERPHVVEIDAAIYDAATRQFVMEVFDMKSSRPRPYRESVRTPIHFVVPDLSPGSYEYALGVTPKNQSAATSFVILSFNVASDCPFPGGE